MKQELRDHLLSIFISLVIAAVVWRFASIIPHPAIYDGVQIGDVGVSYAGLRNWLSGEPVYYLQGDIGNKIVHVTAYPFTASLVDAPLLLIPLKWIAPFFSAFSAGILAYGILKKGELWRLLVFISFPFVSAVQCTQWSPLFAAALYLPALLPIVVVKPQLGIPLVLTGRWSKPIIYSVFGIILVSLILYPRWPLDYLRGGYLNEFSGLVPISVGIGVLMLLLIIRWRSRQGRLLLAMSVIPQRLWYDQLLVLFIPHSIGEQLVLVVSSWMAVLISKSLGWIATFTDQDYRATFLMILLIYFPAFFMVLREKDPGELTPFVVWIDKIMLPIRSKFLSRR